MRDEVLHQPIVEPTREEIHRVYSHMGRLGAAALARTMTKEQRHARAMKAARTRWETTRMMREFEYMVSEGAKILQKQRDDAAIEIIKARPDKVKIVSVKW